MPTIRWLIWPFYIKVFFCGNVRETSLLYFSCVDKYIVTSKTSYLWDCMQDGDETWLGLGFTEMNMNTWNVKRIFLQNIATAITYAPDARGIRELQRVGKNKEICNEAKKIQKKVKERWHSERTVG